VKYILQKMVLTQSATTIQAPRAAMIDDSAASYEDEELQHKMRGR
jgi:hypothetical protein